VYIYIHYISNYLAQLRLNIVQYPRTPRRAGHLGCKEKLTKLNQNKTAFESLVERIRPKPLLIQYCIILCFLNPLLIHHFNIHYILLLNAPISVEQINKKHLNRVAIALCNPGKASAQSRDTFPKKKNLNRVALCHPGKASAQKRGGERGKKNPHKWENKHHNRVTRFQKKKNLNRVALCHLGKGSAKVIRHFVVCW